MSKKQKIALAHEMIDLGPEYLSLFFPHHVFTSFLQSRHHLMELIKHTPAEIWRVIVSFLEFADYQSLLSIAPKWLLLDLTGSVLPRMDYIHMKTQIPHYLPITIEIGYIEFVMSLSEISRKISNIHKIQLLMIDGFTWKTIRHERHLFPHEMVTFNNVDILVIRSDMHNNIGYDQVTQVPFGGHFHYPPMIQGPTKVVYYSTRVRNHVVAYFPARNTRAIEPNIYFNWFNF